MKVKRTPKKIIHAIAHCESCSFMDELYSSAARSATKHTKETGHRVAVELGIHYNTYEQP